MVAAMVANVKISKGMAGRITITFPYDPVHIAKIKAVGGSKWYPCFQQGAGENSKLVG